MKRTWAFIAAGLLLLLSAVACSETITESEYTDVPDRGTQDAVVSIALRENYAIDTRRPDAASVKLLSDIYRFVWDEKNRPVRYFDEETQQKIRQLAQGVDIDILHMTEFMSVSVSDDLHAGQAGRADILLDVDYTPGQLVIAVMGVPTADGAGIAWLPYRCEVTSKGRLQFDLPAEDLARLTNHDVYFVALTDRTGARGNILENETKRTESMVQPSKSARDITSVTRLYSYDNQMVSDDFQLRVVDLTEAMTREVEGLRAYLADGNALLDWFDEDARKEAQLYLPQDTASGALKAYEIIAVESANYHDTYGDVAGLIRFATPYEYDQSMVVMLGFPGEDAAEGSGMTWMCLGAEALDDCVNVVFKQLALPEMEKQPAMLVVVSAPLSE